MLPDQRLHVIGRNEVLFRLRKRVGQIGKRPDQVRAASGGRAGTKKPRRLPADGPRADYGVSGEIMRADKERVIVQTCEPGGS